MSRRRIGFWYRFAAVICETAAGGSVQAGLAGNGAHSGRRRIYHRGQSQLVSRPALLRALPVQHRPRAAIPGEGRPLQERLRRRDACAAPARSPSTARPPTPLGAFRAAVDAIEQGECVAFYPEGTLTRDPDMWPMAGKTGAARVALLTKAPGDPGRPVGRQPGGAAVRQGEASSGSSRARPSRCRPDRRSTSRAFYGQEPTAEVLRRRPRSSWPRSPRSWRRSAASRRPPTPYDPRRSHRAAAHAPAATQPTGQRQAEAGESTQ